LKDGHLHLVHWLTANIFTCICFRDGGLPVKNVTSRATDRKYRIASDSTSLMPVVRDVAVSIVRYRLCGIDCRSRTD